ncbi:MAG: isoprenylcysteine carboxylmethyltransferase family protein [Candidatus Omnitrophica bacterium]|nr:isoprenylcysteine carboxylmethyltransferase family protein [Candidatus Omnitrophota bacterium]
MMLNKYWVAIQTAFLLLIVLWPFKIELSLPDIIKNTGMFFCIVGLVLMVVAAKTLKDNLRPSPIPKVGGELITTGLYSIVRHPAYSAIIIMVFSFSLWTGDAARLMLSACLLFFFNAKSKMEEKKLKIIYPEYVSYQKQVNKKFIPGVL